MCTKNNAQKGYVNGTIGTVIGFEPGTKYPIIKTATMDRIVMEPADWSIEENGKVKASITQIPLRLAWAITIHKSQGMSIDRAVMDLREVFEYGQGYVALSRVRTLDGLHLLGWNDRTFQIHPKIRSVDSTFFNQSETAKLMFGNMTKDEIQKMHHNFILASGGTIDKKIKKEKRGPIDTTETTLMMVLQGKPISTIAKERGLTMMTIYGHIEKLAAYKRLVYDDIDYLIEDKVRKGYNDIKRAFTSYDTTKLAPLYEHYKGMYTYDDLRLARMMIVLGYTQ